MVRHIRFLKADAPSSATRSPGQPPASVDSGFVVVLASLLCALICMLGLVAVARCAWIRRLSARSLAAASSISLQNSLPNKGIKKKVLKSLPRETFSDNMSAKHTECAICLSEFLSGEEIRVLPHCGHGFHVNCIDTWLSSRSSCPSCRQILVVARCQQCGGLPPPQPTPASNIPASSSTAQGTCQRTDAAEGVHMFLP